MSTENVKIVVNNQKVEVKWVAEYCDHYMSNFIHDHSQHDLSFQQISNMVRDATFVHYKRSIWFALGYIADVKYKAVIILTSYFAVIKTCYRNGWNI